MNTIIECFQIIGGKMKKKWKIALIVSAVLFVLFEILAITILLKEKSSIEKKKQVLKLENDKKEKKIKEIDAQIKQLKLEQEDLKKAKGVSGNAK